MRRSPILLFFVLFLLCFRANGQMLEEWSTKFGSKFNSVFYASNMVIDENQNAYICVHDKLSAGVNNQFSIFKINSQGLLQWRLDGLPYASLPRAVYATISPSDKALFYHNGFLYYVNFEGLRKYDCSGNLIWNCIDTAVSSAGMQDFPRLAFDSKGDISLTWIVNDSQGKTIYRLKGIDSNGVTKWDYSHKEDYIDWIHQLSLDSSDNTYISFSYNNSVHVMKYASTGNLLFATDFLTPANATIMSINPSHDSLFVFMQWSGIGDSVFIFDNSGNRIGQSSDIIAYKRFMFFVHNAYYDFKSWSYNDFSLARWDLDRNITASRYFPNSYYWSILYNNGFFYAVANPTNLGTRTERFANIFKLDTNLQLVQTITLEYANPKPPGYGNIYTMASIDSLDNIFVFISGWSDSGMVFKVCQRCTPNIQGTSFRDGDGDCQMDSNEYRFKNRIIELKPGPHYTSTDRHGSYAFLRPYGDYTIKQHVPDYWSTICYDSLSIHLDSVQTNSFGNVFDNSIRADVSDRMIDMAASAARPGFGQSVSIVYTNNGTKVDSGWVQFNMSGHFGFLGADPPYDSATGSSFFWKYNSLDLGESRVINITLLLPANVPIGQIYHHSGTIGPLGDDVALVNNFDTIFDIIRGSYDPNDKLSKIKNANELDNLTDSSTLFYTIRFQNTGTDTAINIVVLDTLDQNLDVLTLKMLQAPFGYEMSIIGDRIIKWTFNHIMLPDSHTNELFSHGLIKYSIRPNSNLPIGAVVRNSASIYFDFNVPVITNTTVDYYLLALGLKEPERISVQALVIPNPMSDYARIQLSGPSWGGAIEANTYDVTGKLVMRNYYADDTNMKFDRRALQSGLYLIELKQNGSRLAVVKIAIK